MTSARALAIAGIAACVLTMLGGFLSIPWLVGSAGFAMLLGNLYALWRG